MTNHSPLTTHLLLATLFLLLFGCGQPQPKPLTGKLTVLVRPPDRNLEPVPIEQPGSAPVQSGGAMCIDAKFDEPAFIYIVWLDSQGQVLPLYPWNNERLEVTDVNQPPPLRRAGKLVFSPLLGNSWTFSNHPGAETVLLLARRTALPEETKLGPLLKSPPPPPSSDRRDEIITVRLAGHPKPGTKSTSAVNPPSSEALAAYLTPLTDHFDLIHAVQFTHQGEKTANGQ